MVTSLYSTQQVLPFMGKLPSEMEPGCRIRLRGVMSRPNGDCRIHLQSGECLDPMDNVALHLNILPATREILRNSYSSGHWGQEERAANSPINFDEEFNLVIGADSGGFNIEINGNQFTSFSHRFPVQSARALFITGGCVIRAVIFEHWHPTRKVISVNPSAPVLNPQPSSPPMAIPFQIPSWPHGNFQHFPLPPSPLYPHVPYPAYNNPAMFFQHPLMSMPE